MDEQNRTLTTPEAAEWLGLSTPTLARWRGQRVGPPYIKLGPKSVRYRISDLDSWQQAQVVDPGEKS